MEQKDTIFAPSSAVGGAIAVLRISGPEAGKTVCLFDRDVTIRPGMLTHVCMKAAGELIDDCMAVFFRGPASYTGEDMVEINCHGGVETVRCILELLGGIGFRPAAGGEFTKRAFMNGKMDLSQAEAVMDLINATAEQSRKAAILQLAGSVSEIVQSVEQSLLDALSGIDAAIDYPDEAEADMVEAMPGILMRSMGRLEELIDRGMRGKVLRDGVRVAMIGKPNVGKSSLMNALLGTDRAIVTANAGTTRDVLDEQTSFSGVPIRLIDTAGLRETQDEAEKIGVDRAREALQTADVVCLVLDGSAPLTPEDQNLLLETRDYKRIVISNKSDLPAPENELHKEKQLLVSAKTGQGLETLKERILNTAGPMENGGVQITNQRHITALKHALEALHGAQTAKELDCAATDIRNALHFLGSITGTDVDAEVIDRIFANFCVGK